MAKRSKKTRASASRAKGAKKGATKGAKKSAVKGKKMLKRAGLLQEPREGLDVKKLKTDLQRAIETLQRRIDEGDPAKRLPETRALFLSWVQNIEETVCVGIDGGPCGEDMFFGS